MSVVGGARCVRPDRHQLEWRVVDPEGLLPLDHRARVVWGGHGFHAVIVPASPPCSQLLAHLYHLL